jgi:Mrp family chromosome partitioning ATPase
MRPNDLRHYLNQRLAASAAEPGKDADKTVKAPKSGGGKTGPVLKSLDAVLNHILAPGKGIAPRALLVAGATPEVDATQEAIQIARGLVARREQVVLLDLTRCAAAVSGQLGLPRAPGFTDLAAGRASFEDVVRIDSDSPLQVIAAGNPAIKPDGEETDSFMRVFEALTHVYDCVVLHADRDVIRKLRPALKFELPASVAILPPGTTSKGADSVDLTEFTSLGCPVVVYEQSGKEPRSGLFGLAAG